jgi:ribose transport system ATP-binding protein
MGAGLASENGLMLSMHDVCKSFPGVVALDNVNLELRRGEVHALIGENGAGKSTLIKILAGVYTKDRGELVLEGRRVEIDSPHHAQQLGIYTIFQELATVENLSIAENMFLGREIVRNGLIDRERQIEETSQLLSDFDYHLDPRRIVGELNVAEQKMISIIKALNNRIKILVLDEPTASLTDREADILFSNVDRLREQGAGIIYISHRLKELKQVGDRVTVLRNGKYIGTLELKKVASIDELTPLMIGKEITNKYPKVPAAIGETLLRVNGLSRHGHFQDVSFEARRGEVLGFFGLVGCGFEEILRSVFGAAPYDAGTVEVLDDGGFKAARSFDPRSALDLKVSYIPRDRKNEGLVMSMSVNENIALASLQKFSARFLGWIKRRAVYEEVRKFIQMLGIKVADPEYHVETLSGGNQQKVVIAKALCRGGSIFLFCEPTTGIDVGTKVEIYQFFNKLTADGAAVVFVSYELPEIMGMSDRILVMYHGGIVKEYGREEATEDDVLRAAFGSTDRSSTVGSARE